MMDGRGISRDMNIGRMRDLPVHSYNQKQLNEVAPTQVKFSANAVQPTDYFIYKGKSWEPNAYPGYAVISMVNNNPGNDELTPLLINIQNELHYNLQPLNAFYMLPAASFHQTVANTLSADRFIENVLAAGLDKDYPAYIDRAFQHTHITRQLQPIRMRLIGLAVFGTAIGVLGTFDSDADYKRITDFRSGFYEDAQLNNLDVKMTRPFIGHITLGYAAQKLNKNQREHLANTINEINEQVFSKKHYFNISQAELRRYDHLAEFKTEANYPVYPFTL
jgi:hypothetical protein